MPESTEDIVEISRQRLADGRHVADHNVRRLIGIIVAQRIEIERLRTWLQTIVDCWAARSELYTSDTAAAANFADRAKGALKGKTYA